MTDVARRYMPATCAVWGQRRQQWGWTVLVGWLMLTVGAILVPPSTRTAVAQSPAAKPTGDLRIAMPGIGNMRPMPWQESAFAKGYLVLLYDFLVGGKADGSPSTENGAAERWEMSPDARTWTFWLRKGITFHDGTELTAEDAKWSLER